MTIAIAHDQFRTLGGAERVAIDIAREFDAPIYTMRVDPDVPPDDVEVIDLSTRLGGWIMRRHYMLQDAYQMLAWQHVDELYEYDTIIETKTNPYWFVPKDTQTVIRYVHSTPRNMYDQFHRRGGFWLKDGLMTVQRMLYQQVIPYADTWVANSDIVKHRLQTYFGLSEDNVSVVYPGVDTSKTGPQTTETGDYLFYVGRLAVNKRIDLLREIAAQTNWKVKVAGTGAREDDLQPEPPNLEYLGYISEREKWRRLSEARGFLMLAENEDFGITPIEAMAAGTPVIGANEGFTKHQIKDGKNGYLTEPTVTATTKTLDTLETRGVEWSDDEIAQYASQYNTDRFRTEMRHIVEQAVSENTVTVTYDS